MNDDDRLWGIVVRRERTDAVFLYGVRTTGIYCRPGCASRTPRRENVRFYANASDAERDGLRACRRCGGGERMPPPH
jgi:AraC family transcriptional regulator, regulatory protein of adaptative response / methylated-DNA-[protein]-cysteine methyltransferase